MIDYRLHALAALAAVGLAFLGGVRVVFERPKGTHPYHAARVSAAVLLVEAVALVLAPVPRGRLLSAGAILATSLMLFLWAAWTSRERKLGLAFAGRVSEFVQTRGPYRLVRHPFYLSYLLAFLGGALAAGSPWLAPAVLAGALTYWRAARHEEAAFEASPLRDAYRCYARQVGMFVPRLPGVGYGSTMTRAGAGVASSRSPEGNAG